MSAINRRGRAIRVGSLAVWLTAATLSGRETDPRATNGSVINSPRVLIITGQGDHDWRATVPFLRRVLTETAHLDVRVCESPSGLSPKTLADFDVVVYDCGSAVDAETRKAIRDFIAGGKGLVVTRAAMTSFTSDWPELTKIADRSKPAGARAAATAFVEVKLNQPDHPIVKGMTGPFMLADSLEHGLSVAVDADVIAQSGNAPVLFTFPLGKGRVFCSGLGNDLAAMQAPEFLTTFARGIQWAAGGEVTLPPNLTLPQPNANAVRTLLITGGHDHESTFYGIFDGYKDLTWTPVSSSAMAFQKDIRAKYDVLILYDFSRDLDYTAKENLHDFVESGKGVVVLHHALLNYQAWPWWYQKVVGGSYRLAPEGDMPASTVKDAQRMFITPHQHPITAGIAPFRLTDETYKRMWIAPDVQPLLTTDNPFSDATIAWVSPYEKSRVVYIQLGHGRGSYFHPSFRALVHKAILWTAGRLNDPDTKPKNP